MINIRGKYPGLKLWADRICQARFTIDCRVYIIMYCADLPCILDHVYYYRTWRDIYSLGLQNLIITNCCISSMYYNNANIIYTAVQLTFIIICLMSDLVTWTKLYTDFSSPITFLIYPSLIDIKWRTRWTTAQTST